MDRSERRSLSRPLAQRLWGDPRGELPPLVPQAGQETYPLTAAQEQIWVTERLVPGRPVYNVCQAYALDGDVDAAVLRKALAELARRHESLRTGFYEVAGRPVMRVEPAVTPELAEVDLRERPGELRAHLDAEALLPFELSRAPLLRATLYHLGPARYALGVTSHHLIQDGASRGIIGRDLGRAYDWIAGGVPFETPALGFGDFARWQRGILEGEALEKQRRFWQAALAAPRACAELPADRARGPADQHRGARYRHAIDAETFEALRALGRANGASTFMTLAAAYMALVFRYSGEPDVVVGFPTAGRMVPQTAGLTGCFVNTLALRADLSDDPSFRVHLERVRDFALGAYDNQDLPFNSIVEELRVERSLARPALFSTMVSLVERDRPTLSSIAGLGVTPLDVNPGTSVSDMTLELRETSAGLSARFEYNSDLFDRPTVERFARHFEALVRAAATQPDLAISRLPLLDGAERRAVLALGSGDFSGPALERPFHELFEEQAAREPSRLALEFGDERVDYRTLNARANALARRLIGAGVAQGAIVALSLDRSVELIVALLGILKAGAAFLPLDPTLPGERLRFMLEETAAAPVLTRHRDAAGLAGINAPLLLLDGEESGFGLAADPGNPGLRVALGDLAYVLYTSGSTGRPKGVMVPQRAFVNHMLWMRDAGLVAPADRVLQKTPIGFDVALWECFAPLLAGACIVLAQPLVHRDSAALVATIVEREISVTGFVPAMLRFVVEEPRFVEARSLRSVFSAGEALPLELARRFAARSKAELYNLYGPTETTIHSTAWHVERDAESIAIGRPIARTRAYVLEPSGEPAPLGVAGELCIGGDGVAIGYLARPDLTARAFAVDPFAEAGTRYYRTGDRARLLPDGNIDYLGRRDRQVKIRGQRIELGEIEAVLTAQPGVAEAAVVLHDLGESGPVLAAYLALRAGQPLGARELRARAAEILPDAMLPAFWTELASLPKTASGKIDYKALPRPAQMKGPLREPPQGEIERAIAGIWSSLLDRTELERNESFFDAGGHSLLAMRALARMNGTLGASLSLAEFFKEPTIAALAAVIARSRVVGPTASPAPAEDPIEEHVDPAELSEIRAELEGLGDEEIDALLRRALGEV